jgi:hypothetical protein
MGLIQTVISQNLEDERQKKRIDIEKGQFAIQQLMKSGGSFDAGTLQKIADNAGIPVDVLQNIGAATINPSTNPDETFAKPITAQDYDSRFGQGGSQVTYNLPSAEERANKAEVARIQQTAKPAAEAKKVDIETNAGPAAQAQKTMIETTTPAKVAEQKALSTEVTLPALKQHLDWAQQNALELQNGLLSNQEALFDYERKAKTTTPTPEEADKHNVDVAHAQHLQALTNFYNVYKGQLAEATIAAKNAATANTPQALALKTHADQLKSVGEWMKVNQPYMYQKGKSGKITPVEYKIGSPEEKSLLDSAKAAGVELSAGMVHHTFSADTNTYTPVVPAIPTIPAPAAAQTPVTTNPSTPSTAAKTTGTPAKMDFSKGTPVKTKSGRPAVKMPDNKVYYTDGK